MKKLLLVLPILALMLGFTAIAHADTKTETDWKLNAPKDLTFVCSNQSFVHRLNTVTSGSDGAFTGTGFYKITPGTTWDMTGKIDGNKINFTIVYTVGTTYNAKGTIASDGSISGTSDGNCQSFTMGAGSATQVVTNDEDSQGNDEDTDTEDDQGQTGDNQGQNGDEHGQSGDNHERPKNHGYYVSTADKEDRHDVAQSRLGMPSQSKGHTKED